jgi:quinol-cytochrome oxidoreductase complex cytochrome b subunit
MAHLREKIRRSQIWRSIFRHPSPRDRRNRVLVVLTNLILHLHPVSIPKHALALSFTWGMGGLCAFLFVVETITGVLLMFYYRPTLEWAYQDMLALRDTVSFGVLRELHRWAGHGMVVAVWLHMYRVFLTGSYKPPREFNWGVGVILLVLTLLLSFTGYLLPWDQLAMWAVTVGSNMARAHPLLGQEGPGAALLTVDGRELITGISDARFALLGERFIGEGTLNRFYVLHCIALPLAAAFLSAVHFWRVRKDGGISGPPPARPVNSPPDPQP